MSYGSFYRYMSTSPAQWGGEPSSEVILMFAEALGVPAESLAGPSYMKELNLLMSSIKLNNIIVPVENLQPDLDSCLIGISQSGFNAGDTVIYDPNDKCLQNQYIVITDGEKNSVFLGGNPEELTYKHEILGKLIYKIQPV